MGAVQSGETVTLSVSVKVEGVTQSGEGGDRVKEEKDSGAPDVDAQRINLKVLHQDGSILHFQIKKNTALRELKDTYAARANLPTGAIGFFYKGQPVLERHTPMDLEMKEGDTIEVKDRDEGRINLKVEKDLQIAHFKISKNAEFNQLMNAYAERVDLRQSALRFIYEGRNVSERDTPMGLEMKEGDTIYVFKEVPDRDAQYINFKVLQDGYIVHFKTKKHTALKELMQTYAERANLQRDAIRFLYQGRHVLKKHTPYELMMKEGDTIEVFKELPDRYEGPINLKVLQDGNTVHFKIKKNATFKDLMNTYSKRVNLYDIRFIYEGCPVNEGDTPMELEMEEGDTIEVFKEQYG